MNYSYNEKWNHPYFNDEWVKIEYKNKNIKIFIDKNYIITDNFEFLQNKLKEFKVFLNTIPLSNCTWTIHIKNTEENKVIDIHFKYPKAMIDKDTLNKQVSKILEKFFKHINDITKLNLIGISPESFPFLNTLLPTVESLGLHITYIDKIPLNIATKLKDLKLDGYEIAEKILENTSLLTNLNTLYIDCNSVNPLKLLEFISKLSKLKHLELRNYKLDSTDISHIKNIQINNINQPLRKLIINHEEVPLVK